jgi:hypothetical protein
MGPIVCDGCFLKETNISCGAKNTFGRAYPAERRLPCYIEEIKCIPRPADLEILIQVEDHVADNTNLARSLHAGQNSIYGRHDEIRVVKTNDMVASPYPPFAASAALTPIW